MKGVCDDRGGSERGRERRERWFHCCWDAVTKLAGSSRIVQRKKLSMLRSMSTSFGVTTLRTMLFLLWPVAQARL